MCTKIAIIGFGFMGQTHAGNLLRIPDVEITGVVDFNDPVEQLRSIKGNNDAVTITPEEAARLPWYKTWDELLTKAGKPDAVIVAVPTRFHCSAVTAALENGCHVMVEKPFATSVAECQQMIDTAEKNGKILSVGYVVRCFAEYNTMRDTVRSGSMGKLQFMEMRRFAGIPGWGSWLDPEVIRHSGGTLFDLLSHDLDFALYTLGKPASLRAQRRGGNTFKGDWLSVELDYNDFTVLIESAFVPPVSYPFHQTFQVFFEAGSLYSGAPGTLTVCREKEAQKADLPEVSPYSQEAVNFVNAVRSGSTENICTGKDALVTIEYCAQIRRLLGEEK